MYACFLKALMLALAPGGLKIYELIMGLLRGVKQTFS
jgi:hypothetical protein